MAIGSSLTSDPGSGEFALGPIPAPAGGTREAPKAPTFSMKQARDLLADEDLRHQPWRYWTDLLASYAGLGAAMQMVPQAWLPWPVRLLGFAVSVVLAYRCALFIHELSHLPDKQFRGFRFVWNLLVGIPFLIPTFVYQTHLDHHRRRHYGTTHDGEYLPFGSRPIWHLVGYLAQSFLIPPLAIFRFGVLTPLTWLGKPIRDWVHRHASSMIIDPMYCRPLPSEKQLRGIRLQEVACFLFLVVAGVLAVGSWYGYGPLRTTMLPQVYATAVCVVFLNAVRTLGAHRYYNDPHANDDQPMTFTEQLVDSINYPRRPWLTVLWAPVGLPYHALHHLFPTMPYHAMAAAHKKLMAGLPADSPYRQTECDSLLTALGDLWRRARESGKASQTG